MDQIDLSNPAMGAQLGRLCLSRVSNGDDARDAPDDDLLELLDDEEPRPVPAVEPWLVLIVDDDPSVHAATGLATARLRHRGRPIRLLSAYSGREAADTLREVPGVALALVDVVMETEHAGLDLVKFVREELQNLRVRLVVRTGQAGTLHEATVRRDYPIDDFCQKSDLTAGRLRDILAAQLDEY